MSTNSMVVGLVMLLASVVGCGVSTDIDDDELDEVPPSEINSAFVAIDDVPRLPTVQLPRVPQLRARPPIWDIQHYLDELKESRLSNCYMVWLTLLEPSRGSMQVPVTVCK